MIKLWFVAEVVGVVFPDAVVVVIRDKRRNVGRRGRGVATRGNRRDTRCVTRGCREGLATAGGKRLLEKMAIRKNGVAGTAHV